MASEFLADIEGKLEKLTEPHHVSNLSRYDSYILELTQYIVTLNDQKLKNTISRTYKHIYSYVLPLPGRLLSESH